MRLDTWKHQLVVFTIALLFATFPIFLVTRLYRALLGVGALRSGGGPAFSAVGQKLWNVGHGRGRFGIRDLILIKCFSGSTKNPPYAFPACPRYDRLLR